MTDLLVTAIQRAIDTRSQIYNRKSNCPDDRRDAELKYLYQLAEQAPDGAAVELGVRTGGSFLCWSMARDGRGPLYAVDDWSSKTRDLFFANVAKYGVTVETVTGKSWEAAAQIEELAAEHPDVVKIWVDDRFGDFKKTPIAISRPITAKTSRISGSIMPKIVSGRAKDISTSTCVNSGCRSARRSSSRKQRQICT